jgi:hypothetical protein
MFESQSCGADDTLPEVDQGMGRPNTGSGVVSTRLFFHLLTAPKAI